MIYVFLEFDDEGDELLSQMDEGGLGTGAEKSIEDNWDGESVGSEVESVFGETNQLEGEDQLKIPDILAHPEGEVILSILVCSSTFYCHEKLLVKFV